jgi:hypothetical protein
MMKHRKMLALLMTFCMIFQMTGTIALAGDNGEKTLFDKPEASRINIMAVTGSAITYYVGGDGASNENSGTESTAPFATLAKATEVMNGAGEGEYDIIVQGNTTETQQSQIGDGEGAYDVTIRTVTGSAIIMRDSSRTGDLITVKNGANVILGDNTETNTSELIIDGGGYLGRDYVFGSLINVNEGGSLSLFPHVTLERNRDDRTSYNGYGGAVHNSGAFYMYGGTIQNNYAMKGSGVYNEGSFMLYDGAITNNDVYLLGGGVYNDEVGLFEMYGGAISDNDSGSNAGGVANDGTFKLIGGTISGNYSNSSGGFYNTYTGIFLMSGGTITYNRSDYYSAGIVNSGSMILSGGIISNNVCPLGGAGISNYSSLEMTGGVIEENTADFGAAVRVCEGAVFHMSGGTIQNNTAVEGGAVYNEGEFILSGNANIPSGTDHINDIHLVSPMTIGATITGFDGMALTLDNYSNAVGEQWLKETTPGLVAANYSKFISTNSRFIINNKGIVEYIALPLTYYIGGTNASDTNEGTSPDQPFATLEHAFEVGNDADSTFILQSDQEINRTVFVKGNITITTNGTICRITRSNDFYGDYMFRIEESVLTLGNSENTDLSNTLIIDGENVYDSDIRLFSIVDGVMNLYSGAVIKNNNLSEYCITNLGTFNMYGGSIEGNSTRYEGIIANFGLFNLSGGSICNNLGSGVYNAAYNEYRRGDSVVKGNMHMSGGAIYNNSAEIGSGIYNEGNLSLSGSASFSQENSLHDDIYLADTNGYITINGNLSTSEQIMLSMNSYIEGIQVLNGEEKLLISNYNKFVLGDLNYCINEQGLIQYSLPTSVYYVKATGDDNNEGTITAPFATIKKAITEINGGIGTIIIQSDLTITEPMIINGTVNLLSDGSQHTIYRGHPFSMYSDNMVYYSQAMFLVFGRLNLGSSVNGNDEAPGLILDGGGELGIEAPDPMITNYGSLYLYSGIVLQNNNSMEYDSEAVRSYGNFYMLGGIIQNNSSEYEAGVSIRNSTFVMNGGCIRENSGIMSGVSLYGGTFTMNGGSISENISALGETSGNAGIYARADSTVTMNGGSITGNHGGYAGVVIAYYSNAQITGGYIEDNTGMQTGLIAMQESTLNVSGGNIGGNIGSEISGVIVVDANILLSGNPIIENDNPIILCGFMYQPVIEITAPLSGTAQLANISIMRYNESTEEVLPEYTIGRQVIVSGEDYTLTQADISRFKLSDPIYGINPEGKLGTMIRDNWVTLAYAGNVAYNGKAITVDVRVSEGINELIENIDYTVAYNNNYQVGTATVTVTGIGNYAGIVTKEFTINKTIVQSIQTPAPAVKTFMEGENKTAQELLNSITLSMVDVITDTGSFRLPIEWSITEGTFNKAGGTYTYIGTVIGNNNISANGLTLTTKIIVKPEVPYIQENRRVDNGGADLKTNISYFNTGGGLSVEFNLTGELDQETEGKLVLPISSKKLINQFGKEEFTELNITVTLPNTILGSDNPEDFGIILDAELLDTAKKLGKDISVTITDEKGNERYSWTFTGQNLKNSTKEVTDIDLALTVKELENTDEFKELQDMVANKLDNTHSLMIDFGHDGTLPAQARIRIYVGEREGILPGSRIYLYHYNPETGKLETLPFSTGYIVDDDGYITIDILHCSDYAMLMEEADSSMITSLKNQITLSVGSEIISIGKGKNSTTNVIINLPETLELLQTLEAKTSQSAIGAVTATYQSSNEKVATVDSNGKITAKGSGLTTIVVKVTLYSGKVKTFKTIIRVKKA